MKYFLLYLLLINAAGFILMLTDKLAAMKNTWRVRESTLMAIAVFGGSIGTLLGMYMFRHKTNHLKFFLGIPVILALQIVISILILTR